MSSHRLRFQIRADLKPDYIYQGLVKDLIKSSRFIKDAGQKKFEKLDQGFSAEGPKLWVGCWLDDRLDEITGSHKIVPVVTEAIYVR